MLLFIIIGQMNLGDINLKLYDNVFIMIKFLWNICLIVNIVNLNNVKYFSLQYLNFKEKLSFYFFF